MDTHRPPVHGNADGKHKYLYIPFSMMLDDLRSLISEGRILRVIKALAPVIDKKMRQKRLHLSYESSRPFL